MDKIAALAIAAVLSGCISSGTAGPAELKGAMRSHAECNVIASRGIALQPGDPVSLALAARGLCDREELSLRQALMAEHRVDIAEEMMRRARAMVLESNAAIIVLERQKPLHR